MLKGYSYLSLCPGQWFAQNEDPASGRRGLSLFVEGIKRKDRFRLEDERLPQIPGERRRYAAIRSGFNRRRHRLQTKLVTLAPGESHTFSQRFCGYKCRSNSCVMSTPKRQGSYIVRAIMPMGQANHTLRNRFEFRFNQAMKDRILTLQ